MAAIDGNVIQKVRDLAFFSVGRACMFALLAIVTVMSGLITWPGMAMRAGAILLSMATVILIFRAIQAPRRPYKRTEVWILIRKEAELPAERAQSIISDALGECYWRFADYAAMLALLLWAIAVVFWLGGRG